MSDELESDRAIVKGATVALSLLELLGNKSQKPKHPILPLVFSLRRYRLEFQVQLYNDAFP